MSLIEALFGENLNNLVKGISSVAVGLGLMFTVEAPWQLCFVCISTVPLIAFCMAARMKAMGGGKLLGAKKQDKGTAEERSAGALITEVVLGVRTVASLGAEAIFHGEYEKRVGKDAAKKRARHITAAMWDAIANGGIPPLLALMIWYGTYLGDQGMLGPTSAPGTECDGGIRFVAPRVEKTMVPVLVGMFTGISLGIILLKLTDMEAAKEAAISFFERLDAKHERGADSEQGSKPTSPKGEITVKDVRFSYPSRPDFVVCRGYSLSIGAGQTVALCGQSGSGKSTVIQLIERFYDPMSGEVLFDGIDIKTLNVKWLRAQLGYVGQEPVLFNGTVRDNIGYGKPGGGATQEEIEEAAKMANAHGFITDSLAEGYETPVGLKGGQLSGGQKQRVAIARAIIRRPAVLLLDEATSALDNESERIVQAALDGLMAKQKRTTVVIAHRLSTIRNADKIAVIDKGKVVEEGTHDELVEKMGLYYGLMQATG